MRSMLAREKWQISTLQVLEAVFEERVRQVARYGQNDELPDGTGPESEWAEPADPSVGEYPPLDANAIEREFRRDYEKADDRGRLTWMHLVREEIAEAFAESDETRLEEELLQVAALCVSWVETIRERSSRSD